MKIAFTICSNNFLAQAKAMFDSLLLHNPDLKTFLFLADQRDGSIEYETVIAAETIVITEEIVPQYADVVKRYSVGELNSAVRPFIFQYISKLYPGAKRLYYLDSDLCFYNSVQQLDEWLNNNDILITPHFLTPVPMDGHTPFENLALNYGTYNLGFLALNPQTENTKQFLIWWGERTACYSHIDLANGYFTDQIWFNLVSLFFRKVHVIEHPGYNMACWNLHERYIAAYNAGGTILLSSGDPLVFYHFSLWDHSSPKKLTRDFTRFNFDNRQDMARLYEEYYVSLQQNGVDTYSKIPCQLNYRKPPKPGAVKKLLTPGIRAARNIWNKL